MFEVTAAKITGTPTASGWSQVHEFLPTDPEKLAKRGHLFAVLSTQRQEEGLDTLTVGRELLSRLHEEYFGNLESSPYEALKGAVTKVVLEFSQSLGEVEMVAVAIVGEVVYSAAGGGAGVAICREGAVAKILESVKGETGAASGYPKVGDSLVLGTHSFFAQISPGVLKASLEGSDLQTLSESLAASVHAAPQSGNMGVVVLRFGKSAPITPLMTPPAPLLKKTTFTPHLPSQFFLKVTRAFANALPKKKSLLKTRV